MILIEAIIGGTVTIITIYLIGYVEKLAIRKGYSGRKYRLLSCFISPYIGLIIVLNLEDKKPDTELAGNHERQELENKEQEEAS